jgi:phosphatidate cytidylyltransferase
VKLSNLAVRLLTAAVFVPLLVLLLYRGPAWGLYLLVFPATLIGTYELVTMTHRGDRLSQAIALVLAGATSAALYFGGHDPRWAVTILAVSPVAGPVLTLLRLGDVKTSALRAITMSVAPLFVAAPLVWLAILRRDDGPGYVVVTLMFAWFGDTGGYFAGRFLGKHKLYEAVSPKKTVEGAFGSLGGSVVGGLLAHFWFLPSIPLFHVVPLALVAGALGQAGDLGESLLKRSTGVKDSGAIVPGHGGILDRIDALVLTSTVVYLYTLWIK